MIIQNSFPYNLLPVIAMLNYFVFFGGSLIDELKRFRKGNGKTSREFRRKVTQIKYEDNLKDYTYKCEVCGKTDAEYPELEFRYCSRCAGYHCFCSEHINNHVHFTE